MARLGLDQPADVPAVRLRLGGEQDPDWMTRHHMNVARAREGGIDLYLAGDSLTDLWCERFGPHFEKTFGRWRTANFAISGDRTEHVLWRLENGELEGVKPRAVMLCIGTNNLPSLQGIYAAKTPEEVASGVRAILAIFAREQSQAKVLLVGPPPREDRLEAAPPAVKEDLNPKLRELHGLLRPMADGVRVKFVEFFDRYLDERGRLNDGMLFDRLHPDVGGYDVWAQAILPTLNDWLR